MRSEKHSFESLGVVERFFNGWQFPAFALSTVVFLNVLMFGVLLLPSTSSLWGGMVQDFKVWCFGYNPTTGNLDWGYVFSMLASTFVLVGVILLVWGGRLFVQLRRGVRPFLPYIAVSFLLVSSTGVTFALVYKPASSSKKEKAFPAEALRTTHTPPSFTLLNQEKQKVSLKQFRGKVVMVTGVYSSCGYTCPMILAQIKRVLRTLPPKQQKNVHVLAITLDPKRDTTQRLSNMAKAHKVKAPTFNLLTGEVSDVNRVLDSFNFARKRNPKTGVIDHVNLFILIDRKGKIAYRFTLGKRQESWLTQALQLLLREGQTTPTSKTQS